MVGSRIRHGRCEEVGWAGGGTRFAQQTTGLWANEGNDASRVEEFPLEGGVESKKLLLSRPSLGGWAKLASDVLEIMYLASTLSLLL